MAIEERKALNTNDIGAKSIFLMNLKIYFIGITRIYLNTCFIIFTINKFTFIKILLNSNIYNATPINTPKNI